MIFKLHLARMNNFVMLPRLHPLRNANAGSGPESEGDFYLSANINM